MQKKQRLELTWIGEENRPKLESRILLEDPEKSYHAKQRVTKDDIQVTHGLFSCASSFKHLESRTQLESSLNRINPAFVEPAICDTDAQFSRVACLT